MTLTELRASRTLWLGRQRKAQRRVDYLRGKAKSGAGDATKGVVTADEAREIHAAERERDHAKAMVARRTRQIRSYIRPTIVTAAQIGLTFQHVFGAKGEVHRGAGHYTAGGRARNRAELIEEARRDHRFHKGKGWGGLSYEAMVADDGTILLGNPVNRKGAAVAGQNSGMLNICCPGTTGDRMAAAQERSVAWLIDNWHRSFIPAAHRAPKNAQALVWRGHNQWPGQSTACPGAMQADYDKAW